MKKKTAFIWCVVLFAMLAVIAMFRLDNGGRLSLPPSGDVSEDHLVVSAVTEKDNSVITNAMQRLLPGSSSQVVAPVNGKLGLVELGEFVDNGYEPDDDQPIPSAEEQVRTKVISARIEFDANDVRLTKRNGYDYIEMDGASGNASAPGMPDIPVFGVSLLIPSGMVIDDISFKVTERFWKKGVKVYPSQQPQNHYDPNWVPDAPNDSVYQSDTIQPVEIVTNLGMQKIRGNSIVPVSIAPVRFKPSTGELTIVTSCKAIIRLRDMTATETAAAFKPRHNALFDNAVRDMILNEDIMDLEIQDK